MTYSGFSVTAIAKKESHKLTMTEIISDNLFMTDLSNCSEVNLLRKSYVKCTSKDGFN